jgi:hypothetical protein
MKYQLTVPPLPAGRLMQPQGIDVLAEHCGVGAQIAQYTRTAMEGV